MPKTWRFCVLAAVNGVQGMPTLMCVRVWWQEGLHRAKRCHLLFAPSWRVEVEMKNVACAWRGFVWLVFFQTAQPPASRATQPTPCPLFCQVPPNNPPRAHHQIPSSVPPRTPRSFCNVAVYTRLGESLAQVLCLAGVRPVADSIGRVNKLELIPLEELGRPRVDVVVSCSGVFRDLFINQMNLLDRGVSVKCVCFFFLVLVSTLLSRAQHVLCGR